MADGSTGPAVCVRCGGMRDGFDRICPACGHRPEGEGLLVAWLLSSANLGDDELVAVQERIRNGEWVRPSARMLDRARRALGTHASSDPGLTRREGLALLATVILATPLVGWVLGAWWWRDRPRTARQAVAIALPATVVFTVAAWWAGSG